ncbi:MAG: class III extradiol ring-cleavage dioxygenase [Polyangiaceae bacterium]
MAETLQPTPNPLLPTGPLMPVAFVGHGAPTLALDTDRGAVLTAFARALAPPSAILVISAHWETRSPTLGTVQPRPLLYDYNGFPEALYRVQYACPPAPEVARRAEALLRPWNVARSVERGLDHGAWVPLVHMFPDASVPVLQLSLPGRFAGPDLLKIGAALAPLRSDGVLILGSGSLTHNLRLSRYEDPSPPPAWAVEFDTWIKEVLARWDLDMLADYRRRSPALHVAHPTEEHFLPLLVAAGAASVTRPAVTFFIEGFEHRSMSRRSVCMA